ncbi:disulfide bond formation protein B, partial [Pelagibacteraceae bacterium]|nr:disulfide bond formation protein B [Pelagibacteraceae bacterium]
VILSFFVLVFNKYEKIVLIMIGLFFASGTAISFYHFGIEQGFFSESLVCDLDENSQVRSSDDLLKELSTKSISCKDVTFRIFGISLATINTVISFIISVIIIRKGLNYDKN